jgi:hypothetical protein
MSYALLTMNVSDRRRPVQRAYDRVLYPGSLVRPSHPLMVLPATLLVTGLVRTSVDLIHQGRACQALAADEAKGERRRRRLRQVGPALLRGFGVTVRLAFRRKPGITADEHSIRSPIAAAIEVSEFVFSTRLFSCWSCSRLETQVPPSGGCSMRCVRKPRRRFLAPVLCASLLAVASCAEDGEDDGGPMDGVSEDGGIDGEPMDGVAGILAIVRETEVSLDGELATDGKPIPFGADLVTNHSGVADFVLGKMLSCRLHERGEVRVGQRADATPVIVIGALWCYSEGTGETSPRLEAAGKIVKVGQSRVRVEVSEEGAEVDNIEGEAILVDNVPLNPGEQIAIDGETGEVGAPIRVPPGTEATEVFEALEATLARLNEAGTEPETDEQTDDATDDEETESETDEQTEDVTDDKEMEIDTEEQTEDTTDDEEVSGVGTYDTERSQV